MKRTLLAQPDFTRFPGWEIVSEGLADAAAGRVTPAVCAIWIAAPRLMDAGLIPESILAARVLDPEIALYRFCRSGGNGHSRYNAFLRRLQRFEHALDRALFNNSAKRKKESTGS